MANIPGQMTGNIKHTTGHYVAKEKIMEGAFVALDTNKAYLRNLTATDTQVFGVAAHRYGEDYPTKSQVLINSIGQIEVLIATAVSIGDPIHVFTSGDNVGKATNVAVDGQTIKVNGSFREAGSANSSAKAWINTLEVS